MKKRRSNTIRRLLLLLCCFCLVLGSFSLVACNNVAEAENSDPTDTENKGEELVEVIRVIDDIKIGGKFTNDRLSVVKVSPDAIPEGAITDAAVLKNKFAKAPLYPGDYITEAKLSSTKPGNAVDEDEDENEKVEIDPEHLGYVVITKYNEYMVDGDYAPAIKKAIEENPGRTIYFPDGTYNIKEPIVIPADPAKSVALRLSHLATITAIEWKDPKVPMIRLGVEEVVETADADETPVVSMEEANLSKQRSIFIIGGVIFGNRQASGISIEGGKDILLYNVSIKSTYNGIHVHYANNENGAVYANVDNVNITGYEATGSSGVLVEGTRNTFSNMRIASVQYGVQCTKTGEGNTFRNLHPLTVGMNDAVKVDKNYKRLPTGNERYTVGFWDQSNGNNFDVCYSDQMASGYLFEENCRTVAIGGFCYWWTERNQYNVGYESNGKFNAIVVSGKVSLGKPAAVRAYLSIGEEGGQGVVLHPVCDLQNDMLPGDLAQHNPLAK